MIYNPLKKTKLWQTVDFYRLLQIILMLRSRVYRFKVHTCSGVHSCCKAQVSTVHAAATEAVKTLRGVHAQPDL